MEKLINGDKFHMQYLISVQAIADKALKIISAKEVMEEQAPVLKKLSK